MQAPGHLVHNVIGLRMYGGVVKRVCSAVDSEKTRALLIGLCAKTGNFQEFFT